MEHDSLTDDAQAQAGTRHLEKWCDHICLKDDGHVERGEPHFYGYEIPSPRVASRALVAEDEELRAVLAATRSALRQLLDAGEEACNFTSGEAVSVFNKAMEAARVLVSDVSTQEPQ